MGMCIPPIAPFGVLRFVASQSPPIAPFSTVSNSYEENQSINSHLVVYIHTIFQLNRHRRTSPTIILARKIGGNPNCNDGLSREFTSWSSVSYSLTGVFLQFCSLHIALFKILVPYDPRGKMFSTTSRSSTTQSQCCVLVVLRLLYIYLLLLYNLILLLIIRTPPLLAACSLYLLRKIQLRC